MPQKIDLSPSTEQTANIETLINECQFDGSWQMGSCNTLLNFIKAKETKEQLHAILSQGYESIQLSADLQAFILTSLAMQILNVHFASKKSEWKMIFTKAKKWCTNYMG